MIICFSIIPFLIAYHNCVMISKWEVFWHWFIHSHYDSFWESVMLPHFSGDKLNSDEVGDSTKSLYCPKVSFQRSEMRERRLNLLLIWAQALFSLALYQCLLPTDLQAFSQFLLLKVKVAWILFCSGISSLLLFNDNFINRMAKTSAIFHIYVVTITSCISST